MTAPSLLHRFRAPLRHPDFRRIWIAQLLSELGDWAARVALGVLVYERSHSAALVALVTALTMLPWIGIGQVLAGLADRYSRRSLMVGCDVLRAVAFFAMAIPQPTWSLLVLATLAGFGAPPFEAARSALIVSRVPEEDYADAIYLSTLTYQVAIVAGALAAGGLLTFTGPRTALFIDGLTFLLSALVVLRIRPDTAPLTPEPTPIRSALTVVMHDTYVARSTAFFAAVSACGVAIEALVPVYVLKVLEDSPSRVGLVAAAVPVGTMALTAVLPSHGAGRRLLGFAALAATITSAAAVLLFGLTPSLPLTIAAFAAVGAMFASVVPANVVYGRRLPNAVRGSAFGIINGVVMAANAVGALVGGAIAAAAGTRTAVIGAASIACAIGLATLVTLPSMGAEPAMPVLEREASRPRNPLP